MGTRMEATRGTLILLRLLAERPMTQRELSEALHAKGLERDDRTLRRWLEALRGPALISSATTDDTIYRAPRFAYL